MNAYLLFFSLYAVLILPMTLRFRLRFGKRSGYRLRLQAAGLPFVRKRTPRDARDEQPIREEDVAEGLASTDVALIRALLSKKVLKRLAALIHWEELSIFARFSFQDALKTALTFAATRQALETLRVCGALPSAFHCRAEADFQNQGTEILVQGIVTFRLGKLLPTAALFASAYLGFKKRSKQGTQDELNIGAE